MSYGSAGDMLKRYDARTLGDLVSDSGTRVTALGLLSDPNLQAALDDASGDIEAALLMGGRYQVSDLTSLTGNSLALLIRINCDCALALLYGRRPTEQWAEQREAAEKVKATHLERLATGERCFNVADVISKDNPTIGGPSAMDVQALNLIRDQTQNYYPARVMPYNR